MGWTPATRKTYYRRNLPHFQGDGGPLFVTFRTYGRIVLPPKARDIALETCRRENGARIHLHGVIVMPTHVHMVFTPLRSADGQTYPIAEIMNSMESVSAHRINKALCRSGHVWQDESFDHVLRRYETVSGALEYLLENAAMIERNPLDYLWLWREDSDT